MTSTTAIVTGATGGLGFQTALGLARQGIAVVVAARNPAKGADAVGRIQAVHPAADVRFEHLDLASLASVAAFAAAQTRCDILINNGAVMGLPGRQLTGDGFEQQIGVNYLAHFALTARLLPLLRNGGRVVNVASVAHRRAVLKLDDLNNERGYQPMPAYAQSKLAMLMFTLELHRRAQRNGLHVKSIAAHPGWARTDIIPNGFGRNLKATVAALVFNALAQPAADGALPILYAATDPGAQSGGYYGPARWNETRGGSGPARIFPHALDEKAAAGLWALSETLTGVIPEGCG